MAGSAGPGSANRGLPLTLAQNFSQGFGTPQEDVGDGGQESSSLLVRIDRLENQMRQLNGQIEQLQFQNRRLEDQLKKFQQDVDFRFQENRGSGAASPSPSSGAAPVRQKRSEAIEDLIGEDAAAASSASPSATPSGAGAQKQRRADAFDPANDPSAPGAPRTLGSAAPQPAKDRLASSADAGPEAPLDLTGARLRGSQPSETARSAATPGGSSASVAALTTPNAMTPGTQPINPVKEEFDVAYGYFRQKEYENAEKGFSAFIQKNPKSRMTADATYYLGESFFQRNRPREAAEQYLKVSTQYASSARAPEAMLRLGQSLSALGAREQACATFAEVSRKYPNAAANVKAGADREAKKAQC